MGKCNLVYKPQDAMSNATEILFRCLAKSNEKWASSFSVQIHSPEILSVYLFSALVDFRLSTTAMRIALIICVMQLFSMMIAQTGSIKRFVILLLDSYSWNVSPTLDPCRCLMHLLFNKIRYRSRSQNFGGVVVWKINVISFVR